MLEDQLLYSRQQAAKLLGFKAIDAILDMERRGILTPIRPTGKPTGQVFYKRAEIEAVANGKANPT